MIVAHVFEKYLHYQFIEKIITDAGILPENFCG